jgi:hypothetical protein
MRVKIHNQNPLLPGFCFLKGLVSLSCAGLFTLGSLYAKAQQSVTLVPFVHVPASGSDKIENPEIGQFLGSRMLKTLKSQLGTEYSVASGTSTGITVKSGISDYRAEDVRISGEFSIEKFQFKFKVRLFDNQAKKEVAVLEYEGQADSGVDLYIDKIALDVEKKIRELDVIVLAQERDFSSQLSVFAGASLVSLPSAFSGALATDSFVSPADLNGTFQVSMEYQFKNYFIPNLFFPVSVSLYNGKRSFNVENNLTQISGSLFSYSGQIGVGYLFRFSKAFYLGPILQGGYYAGKLTMDYSALAAQPFNSATGLGEGSKEVNLTTAIARTGIRFGFKLSKQVTLELDTSGTMFFYNNSKPISISGMLGVGYLF